MVGRRYSAGIVASDISLVVGNDCEVVTTGYRELLKDVAHVSFQCLDGNTESDCGLPVGISASDQIDDFAFSGGQAGDRCLNPDPLVNVQQMAGDIGRHRAQTLGLSQR